jgi:hypothetical protein
LDWYVQVVEDGHAKYFGGILFIHATGVRSLLNSNGLALSSCSRISKPLGLPCTEERISWPPGDADKSQHAAGIVDQWELQSASSYRTESLTRYFKLEHIQTASQRRHFAEVVARIAASLPSKRKIVLSLNYAPGHGSSDALERAAGTSAHPDVLTAVGTLKIDFATHYEDLSVRAASDDFPIEQLAWGNLEFVRSELDSLLPGAGSYYNEGDYTDEQWQDRFWGSNYAELVRTKRKYDPDNVFTCHQCVGSEGTERSSGCARRLAVDSTPILV